MAGLLSRLSAHRQDLLPPTQVGGVILIAQTPLTRGFRVLGGRGGEMEALSREGKPLSHHWHRGMPVVGGVLFNTCAEISSRTHF